MKHVYFVRHGQTLKNLQHIHQGHDEPLTEVGKQQAQAVAEYFKDKNIDTLISSPFTRAVETASIMGNVLSLPFTPADCAKEFLRPEPLYGKSHYSLATALYVLGLFQHSNDPRWDNFGAENMFHIRNRIVDTKRLIAEQPGERIVVISHAIYIDMFTQAVCADRSLKLREFVAAMFGAKRLKNTGIVSFEVDETAPPETCNWWLVKEETDRGYLKYR